MNKLFLILILSLLILPISVQAHRPRLVYDQSNLHENILNPEISQAFYGELKGNSDYYFINSDAPFELYLNILSPDISNAKKDFSVHVSSENENFTLTGGDWKLFYEEFGGDSYWSGPELDKNVSSGRYLIEVTNPGNTGRYSLAVGKIESFPPGESLKSISSIIQLKHDFFNKSYFAFFQGVIGKAAGLFIIIVILIVLAIIFVIKRFRKKKHKR